MTETHSDKARYIRIWIWLAVITAIEVRVATAPLSKGTIISALAAMSLWKALLVALYFMHLKYESRWLLWAAVFPAILSAVTIALILSDTPLFAWLMGGHL